MTENDYKRNSATEAYRRSKSQTNVWLRLTFGIFMVLFYVALGVLLFTPVFNILFEGMASSVAWVRYVVAVVLIIYGFFRGYRLWKGVSYEYIDEE